MDLNNFEGFGRLDSQNLLAQIDRVPDRLQEAWQEGQVRQLFDGDGIRQVLVTGMGVSALAGDLLAAYAGASCPIPILVHRDDELPAWATGPQTLVIACSPSGDSEETAAVFERAQSAGCRCLAITGGGRLAALAMEKRTGLWSFASDRLLGSELGTIYGLLLAAFTRLGLAPDPSRELNGALAALRTQQDLIGAPSPLARNPAKRMAGQMMGRFITVFGAGLLAPVARYWKAQLNRLPRVWGQFDVIPEAGHNTLAGTLQPEDLLARAMALFLRAPSTHARNRLRGELTRQTLMLEGLNTDFIDAQGDNPLAHQWTLLHFGDYTAYYLAMAYEIDPAQGEPFERFKQQLGPWVD
jgi:glucose/mannose-6-phosphate isomerase